METDMKRFIAYFLLIVPLCAQVFYPIQDASVYQYDPNTNYGLTGTLALYSNLFGSNSVKRTLIEFDLTSIPPGTTVQQAFLNIYMYNQAGTDFDVEVRAVLQPWVETTVTWNNQPIHDTDIVNSIPYQGYGWWHFLITPLAQMWVNTPADNHGCKLKLAIEQYPDSLGRAAYYYSHDTTLEQPNLEIITAGIEQNDEKPFADFSIRPNPVRERAQITAAIACSGLYSINIYDGAGRKVQTIYIGYLRQENACFTIDSRNLPGGVYMLAIISEHGALTTPLVVTK